MPSITLSGIVKRFGEHDAAAGVDLEVKDGEFMVLVGPSGCGKSTILRLLAGLDQPSDGKIIFGTERVEHLTPRQRDVAMVFQSYALFPTMTVAENISFGLRVRRQRKAEVAKRTAEAAEILGIDHLLNRRPQQLSGGERQRVAMARAIARAPAVYLFDEPLSNLDAALRGEIRTLLAQLRDRLKTTTIYVTHDQVEAMTLGHRVAVMRKGMIQQCGPPAEVFSKPNNHFVAGFLGSPPMNFLSCAVSDGSVDLLGVRVDIPAGVHADEVVVGVRPTDLHPANASADAIVFQVVPQVIEAMGAETDVAFEPSGIGREIADSLAVPLWKIRLGQNPDVTCGRPLAVGVNRRDLHFFDASTGARL